MHRQRSARSLVLVSLVATACSDPIGVASSAPSAPRFIVNGAPTGTDTDDARDFLGRFVTLPRASG